jgi:hypothetical protein
MMNILQKLPTMNSPKLRGIKYSRQTTRKTPNKKDDQVLHKKLDCESLTPNVRTKLFKQATKLKHEKYDQVPIILNKDGLNDTYNLNVLINKNCCEHCAFDLRDVFTIIIQLHPDNQDNN